MKTFFLTNNHRAFHHLLLLLICILFLILHMTTFFLYLYLHPNLYFYLLTPCHLRLPNLLIFHILNLYPIPPTLPSPNENLNEPPNLLLTSKIIIVHWLRLLLHHSPLRSGTPSLTLFLMIFSPLLTNIFVYLFLLSLNLPHTKRLFSLIVGKRPLGMNCLLWT